MYIPSEKENYRRKVILTICLIAAALGSFGAVAWRWSHGIDAQNHGVRVMFLVVEDFLQKNEGRWPRNWKELESMPSEGHWYDPVNYELLQEEVVIDFTADPRQLAQQTPAEFQAIRAKNPVFDFDRDPRLFALIMTLQKWHPAPGI